MTVSFWMMVSTTNKWQLRRAVESALTIVRPDEALFAVNKAARSIEAHKIVLEMAKGHNVHADVMDGANHRRDIAVTSYLMNDICFGDWIVRLDDDDMALGALPLNSVPEECGMVHTNVLAVFFESCEDRRPGDFRIRASREIIDPRDANLAFGSFTAVRRSAWLSVANRIDRSVRYFDDWRMWWLLIREGWRDCHIPQVLQVQAVGDVEARVNRLRGEGVDWKDVAIEMESEYA